MATHQRFRPCRADYLGVILLWCTNTCVHCLYACSPKIKDDFPVDGIGKIADSIAQVSPHAGIHIGGGEPFLYTEILKELIREIRRQGLYLEYVETNGFWIKKKDAEGLLQEIKEAGCDCLLLSISPFHNAFLSVDDNLRAARLIRKVFGENGIFAWHPNYYPFLQRHPMDRPIPFSEYRKAFSREELRYQLTNIIYLHPAGRAAPLFGEIMGLRPARDFFRKNCREELSSPVHAHVDLEGNYCAGFCAGITVGRGSGYHLKELFDEGVSLRDHPLLSLLTQGTLGDLHAFAAASGFHESPQGYASPCHLCAHIRIFLFSLPGAGVKYPELAPACFYVEMAGTPPARRTANPGISS